MFLLEDWKPVWQGLKTGLPISLLVSTSIQLIVYNILFHGHHPNAFACSWNVIFSLVITVGLQILVQYFLERSIRKEYDFLKPGKLYKLKNAFISRRDDFKYIIVGNPFDGFEGDINAMFVGLKNFRFSPESQYRKVATFLIDTEVFTLMPDTENRKYITKC